MEAVRHRADRWVGDLRAGADRVARTVRGVRRARPLSVAMAVAGVLATMGGMSGQLIALNMWVDHFSAESSKAFTILTITASLVGVLYAACLGVWVLVYALLGRPVELGFLRSVPGVLMLLGCGLSYALNGVLMVVATPQTPELIQAVLLSTGMIWAVVFAASLLGDHHRYCSWLVALTLLLCLSGVLLGVANNFDRGSLGDGGAKWAAIFAAGQLFAALFNVLSCMYMRRFSFTPTVEDVYLRDPVCVGRSDRSTVKLVLLAFSGIAQAVFLFAMLPVDFLPDFGESKDAGEALRRLSTGYRCVFFECSGNVVYGGIFGMCYAATMLGVALLNHYSAPLTTMVSLLGSPMSALVLLVIPRWNVRGAHHSVLLSLGAVLLLSAAAVVYWVFEQSSRTEDPEDADSALLNGADAPYPFLD